MAHNFIARAIPLRRWLRTTPLSQVLMRWGMGGFLPSILTPT
ncbi:MAG TPA: hypothetical protein PL105_16120 [Caldilineaceae bacterium]|nr:hypothetical protein [Caldilineaceae bacterium]